MCSNISKCLKNNLNLRRKPEAVTVGSDLTIFVWLLCEMNMYIQYLQGFWARNTLFKSWIYTVASAPAVTGWVFMRRFRLFLSQWQGQSQSQLWSILRKVLKWIKTISWACKSKTENTMMFKCNVTRFLTVFLLKRFNFGPIWTGENRFAKLFVFVKIFATIVCPRSHWLWWHSVGVVIDYGDTWPLSQPKHW